LNYRFRLAIFNHWNRIAGNHGGLCRLCGAVFNLARLTRAIACHHCGHQHTAAEPGYEQDDDRPDTYEK